MSKKFLAGATFSDELGSKAPLVVPRGPEILGRCYVVLAIKFRPHTFLTCAVPFKPSLALNKRFLKLQYKKHDTVNFLI